MKRPICKILIVDDEPANLLAMEAALEPLQQIVVRASSGFEALKHALRDEFGVVLLDVQMPGMDGFETAELLRMRPKTRDVPIIFLTAINKEKRFVERGYGVGAVDYLFKPYDPDVLRSKVAVFVDLWTKNAEIREQHEAHRRLSERELAEFKRWSERRYVDLADSMPQVVWTTDATGLIQYGNRCFAELARDGAELEAIVHPGDRARFREGWAAAVSRGVEWEAEVRLGNADRGFRVHLVRAVPRRDDAGNVIAWIGTGTDIDARVRAEQALRMLSDASRRLASSFDDPREIEVVLREALPLLGDAARLDIVSNGHDTEQHTASAGDVDPAFLEDPRFDLGPSTVSYSGRAEVVLDVAAEGEELHSARGSENIRFLSELGVGGYMCLPLSSRGKVIGTLTFVRMHGGTYTGRDVEIAEDLARRVAVAVDNALLHAATEQRRAELEAVNKSKDVFLATLSHELRTPLNAIVGWTAMMKNGSLEGEELRRAFDTIDRNAHALAGLVADLLDVSRIVTGTLKLESKLVALASVVEAAVEAARPQCANKRVTLDVALQKIGCVHGDAGRLRQVVGNLLSNAIKFTPPGGTVSVRVAREGQRGIIEVKDTGEGIAPDLLPHVFERFRQADTARTKGLGLGLAIVKHLVEQHGGAVTAASEGKGKGATFMVSLPISAEESLAEEIERPSSGATATPRLDGIHALVVEDDPDGNELITTILERYGARVTSVGTAAAALEALADAAPDVLVSDIGLPDKDGIDLIKTVREREEGKNLPAIALTAYASRQDAAKTIAAGFDAHVAKPVQPTTLGTVVARLVRRGGGELNPPTAA